MELIEGRSFSEERIVIDDKEFRGCTLTDCVLEYSGASVVFNHTRLVGCKYVFFGPARGTVHFLQGVGLLPNMPGEWAEMPDRIQ